MKMTVRFQELQDIKRVKIPRYAYISGVAEQNLVADLDRVMTVEKTVVATWDRIIGCQNDEEIRAFGKALSRKCSRFAFPDDFNAFIRKLQKRMNDKHEKTSDEGLALRALREIRVQATPSWDAEETSLSEDAKRFSWHDSNCTPIARNSQRVFK